MLRISESRLVFNLGSELVHSCLDIPRKYEPITLSPKGSSPASLVTSRASSSKPSLGDF
ncbi:hypothetical protein YC2023_027225 [Brassica napus]